MALLPESLGARLKIAGVFETAALDSEFRAIPTWKDVDFLGWVARKDILTLLANARVGIFAPHPAGINMTLSYPNKIFEYMPAGLPMVLPVFPLWGTFAEGSAIFLKTVSLQSIAEAIQWLIEHPE